MPQPHRSLFLVAAVGCCLANGGCTLVKPVIGSAVGAVAGPALLFAGANGDLGCDGRAIVVVLAASAAIGAAVGGVCGLGTGIVSDVRWLCGYAEDPMAKWWDPFQINDGT